MRTALDIANGYLAVWNEAEPSERQRRLEAWHPDVRYRDPLMQAEGRAALADMIEAARAPFPGLTFHLDGAADGHGPFVRFSWVLRAPNKTSRGRLAGSFRQPRASHVSRPSFGLSRMLGPADLASTALRFARADENPSTSLRPEVLSGALRADVGPAVAAGTDVVRFDAEERIAEVIGFLDEARS